VGDADLRIPDKHYCYWCVLGGRGDSEKYNALQDLARKRRVMYRVNEHGMRTRTDLANDLGEAAPISKVGASDTNRLPQALNPTRPPHSINFLR